MYQGEEIHLLKGTQCSCPAPVLRDGFHFLHSEAIREACDIVIDWRSNIHHRTRISDPDLALDIIDSAAPALPAGSVFHVKSDHLGVFFTRIFPNLVSPFILVSGDSDYGGVRDHRKYLSSPRLFHWFAQNCDIPDRMDKLTRLPIGLDNPIFTKFDKRAGQFLLNLKSGRFFQSTLKNERGDQELLNKMQQLMPAPALKPLRVLCTFHQFERLKRPDLSDKGREPRLEAYQVLKSNTSCEFISHRVAQDVCWRMKEDFAFEASPLGKGLDCHRTWEALYLNTIPIVKSSVLDAIYEQEGFPVVIVDDWREITRENLVTWRDLRAAAFSDSMRQKLSTDYWVNLIRAKANLAKNAGPN